MLQIKKIESKKLKTFQKLLEWISSSTIRAGRARAEEEIVYVETDQECLEISRHIWKHWYHN